MNSARLVLVLVGAGVLVAGCAGGETPTSSSPPPPPSVQITSVEIQAATVAVGGTVPRRATIKDASGAIRTNVTLTWASDNPQVVTVSDLGELRGIAPGSATVRATGGGMTGSATISVLNLQFVALSVDGGGVCGLVVDGNSYCWGASKGTGTDPELCTIPNQLFMEPPVPCSTTPRRAAENYTFVQISTGRGHTCGLTASGEAYCWGSGVHPLSRRGSVLGFHAASDLRCS